MQQYVFGPVPSRRLGLSLGVDLVPMKTCSFNCVYCQLGRTGRTRLRRASFCPKAAVLEQVRKAVAKTGRIDFITFAGSGEPTLSMDLGWLIDRIKRLTDIRIAVLTNGSLLHRPAVRRALAHADLVVPSLDAAYERSFQKVNRPADGYRLSTLIDGLRAFCATFKGEVWLETLLVRGVNDSPAELERLGRIVDTLRIDRVQLGTIERPPTVSSARPLTGAELERAARRLRANVPVDLIAAASARAPHEKVRNLRRRIVEMLERRPCTADDIAQSLGADPTAVGDELAVLNKLRRIEAVNVRGAKYWRLTVSS